jgi:hypothetical protein
MKITSKEELVNIIHAFINKLPIQVSHVLIWNENFHKDTYDRVVNV